MPVLRGQIYEAISKEHEYAQGWGGPEHDAKHALMDWIIFTEKYLNEAKLAYSNYTPDIRAVTCRMLKAASLLVTGLQYHVPEGHLDTIAGVSSSKQYPILHGGLATAKEIDPAEFGT